MEIARERLQGNHSGQRVIADEKGMPIVPVGPNGGPRRMKGPRPPPWVTRGRGSRRDRSSDATAAHGNDFGNVLLNDKVSVGRGRFRGIRNRSPGRVERDDAGASGIHSGSSFYGRRRRGVAVAVGEGKVNSTEQVEDANIKKGVKTESSHIGRIQVARVKQEHRGTDHAYYKSAHQIH